MNLHIMPEPRQLAQAVTARILAQLQQKPDSLLCLAGGDTLLPVFRHLVAAFRTGEADFSRCTFISLDEWVGLGRDDHGSCLQTLSDNLFQPLGLRVEQTVLFDGKAASLAAECQRLREAIARHGGLSIVVAGVGMNGHVGFNEPGADPEADCHVVALDAVTLSVAPKYFTLPQNVTQGITLGLKTLSQANTLILLLSGNHKREVAHRLVTTPPDAHFPASLLRDLPQTSLYLDAAAAALLPKEAEI